MKKVVSIALALLMVAVMLPVMAMAADATEVSTQEALKNAVVAGGNIKLTSDIDLNGSMVIEIDGKLTIDLNGHSIKNSNGAAIILKKGDLVVSGTGSIEDANNNNAGICVKGSNDPAASKHSVLTVNNGVTLKGIYGFFVTPYQSEVQKVAYGVEINFYGKIDSIGGAYINGQIGHTDNCPIINIGNGAIINGSSVGSYAAGYGIWNINGATITGDTGFYIKSGIVNITGSTIKGTGEKVDPVPNGNGANSTGDAIIMDSKNGYAGNMILNLGAGNTITSTNGHALQVANTDAAGTHVTALNITGGNLTGNPDAVKLSQQFKDAVANENINASASITGGTFSGNTNDLKPYIPSNMEITESGNVVNKSITIIVPSEGGNTTTTPSTDNTKNPSTGANDFVGVAAAMAVVSLLGAAAVIRKK